MSNQTYDNLKFAALCIAPVITFVCAVLAIWNIPYTQEITATLAALSTLISAVVAVAKAMYDKNSAEDGEDAES